MAFKHSFSLSNIGGTSAIGATLLLGTMSVAHAQAIVPAGAGSQAAVPVVPPDAGQEAAAPDNPLLQVVFEDVKASQLLGIIAKQFNVPIVINGDINDVIGLISIKDKTPEQAIQAVVTAADLQCRKTNDGTYVIGKVLPPDPDAQLAQAPVAAGANNVLPPLPPVTAVPAGISPASTPGFSGSTWPAMGSNDPLAGTDQGPQLIPMGGYSDSGNKHNKWIRLRNVAPRIMAYWLDPQDNPEPPEFVASDANEKKAHDQYFAKEAVDPNELAAENSGLTGSSSQGYSPVATNPYIQRSVSNQVNEEMQPSYQSNAQFGGGGGNRGGGGAAGRGGAGGAAGVFQLPTGVDRVVAIDPQNALLVYGTDDGIRQLQDTIAFLDRPLRQVEIEAQFVTVSTSDSSAFGIDFSTTQGDFSASSTGYAPVPSTTSPGLTVGFVRGNFQANLAALESSNRAKVIDAPRVTAINNLTASLQTSVSTPVTLSSTTTGIGGQVGTATNLVYITTAIGLTVTPTINNDDTITVSMTPTFSSQTPSGSASGAPNISQDTVQTIANVHDGDIIALGGLKTKSISIGRSRMPLLGSIPFIGKAFTSRNASDTESELIIFLKATIIHRLGDDDAVPGT